MKFNSRRNILLILTIFIFFSCSKYGENDDGNGNLYYEFLTENCETNYDLLSFLFFRPKSTRTCYKLYKDEKFTGRAAAYHKNGKMSFIVEYIDGIEKEHSKKEYYNTGQIISEIINDNEIKNYYPNGKLKKHTDKNFIKEYYPNGVLKLNKVDSLSEHFFENGSLKIREIKTDVYNNTFIEYYKKSKLKSKRIIRFDYWLIEEYNLEGNLIEFSKTDSIHIKRDPSTLQLLLKGEFVGNNKDGVWKHYYENGKIKILETYMYGEKYGDCKEFFDNGKLKERGYYKYGEKYGVFKTYYVNGKLKEKAVYEDDNLHGEYMEYYNNGKLKTIGNYYEGNRIKLFKYFNKDGTLNSAKTY